MATMTAPVGLMTGRRRPTKPGDVLVRIQDLLIVSWDVPAPALIPLVPAGLRLWSRNNRGLVSAVLFRNRTLRPAWFPVPRFSCCQLNIRIYLAGPPDSRPGAVFFHALFLGSPLLARLAPPLVGVPFRHLPLGIDVDRSGAALSYRASSGDDAVRVSARETGTAPVPDAATLDLLTNVHTGFVAGRAGSPQRTWSIWHRNQVVRLMTIDEMRLEPLAELDVELGDPAWTFYVESVDYEVYLPARSAPR